MSSNKLKISIHAVHEQPLTHPYQITDIGQDNGSNLYISVPPNQIINDAVLTRAINLFSNARYSNADSIYGDIGNIYLPNFSSVYFLSEVVINPVIYSKKPLTLHKDIKLLFNHHCLMHMLGKYIAYHIPEPLSLISTMHIKNYAEVIANDAKILKNDTIL